MRQSQELWEERDKINKNLLIDLQGNCLMNLVAVLWKPREASEFHHSHVQVDNRMSVSGCPNATRTVTHHGFVDHTNPTA